jgi:integrase
MTHQGQNSVESIRDPEKIREMKEYLLYRSYRDYFLFTFRINSSLRISDILPLRVMDVKYTKHLRVKEKKAGNVRKIKMIAALKQEIEKYTRGMAHSDYLFPSRKGNRPISRETAWRIINEVAKECGVKGPIGTHTMRKTSYITFTSRRRTWRCCSKFLDIQHHPSPYGILGLMMI